MSSLVTMFLSEPEESPHFPHSIHASRECGEIRLAITDGNQTSTVHIDLTLAQAARLEAQLLAARCAKEPV